VYPNTAVQPIFLRGKFQVSVCMKLFHSPNLPYKYIIKVYIRPIHFCVSCMYFLCAVCVGRKKGTHEGIYTGGLGSCFSVLSGIAVSSFSPGSLPKKSLLHCGFIQCKLFFFFGITAPHSGWKNLKCEEKIAPIFMVYMCP